MYVFIKMLFYNKLPIEILQNIFGLVKNNPKAINLKYMYMLYVKSFSI